MFCTTNTSTFIWLNTLQGTDREGNADGTDDPAALDLPVDHLPVPISGRQFLGASFRCREHSFQLFFMMCPFV